MKDCAPDWLDMLPVFGPLVKASIKTGMKVAETALESGDNTRTKKGIELTRQYLNTILKIADMHELIVIIISDSQWIDPSSCQLLLRLSREAQNHNLVLILTSIPEKINEKSMLPSIRRELLEKNTAEFIALKGWTAEEIRTYISSQFGGMACSGLAEWLYDLCDGQPWFIDQFLDLLRQYNIIECIDDHCKFNGKIMYSSGEWVIDDRLRSILPSKKIEEILKVRFSHLLEVEKEIIELGSIQGKYFLLTVLEELLLKQKENNPLSSKIRNHLANIEKRHQLITKRKDKEWERFGFDLFAFVPAFMQQFIYDNLLVSYRTTHHREIAKILEKINDDLSSTDLHYVRWPKLMIRIARHHDPISTI